MIFIYFIIKKYCIKKKMDDINTILISFINKDTFDDKYIIKLVIY